MAESPYDILSIKKDISKTPKICNTSQCMHLIDKASS